MAFQIIELIPSWFNRQIDAFAHFYKHLSRAERIEVPQKNWTSHFCEVQLFLTE